MREILLRMVITETNLSIGLTSLDRLHPFLLCLPPLLVLNVPQPLLLQETLLQLVKLEVLLS